MSEQNLEYEPPISPPDDNGFTELGSDVRKTTTTIQLSPENQKSLEELKEALNHDDINATIDQTIVIAREIVEMLTRGDKIVREDRISGKRFQLGLPNEYK